MAVGSYRYLISRLDSYGVYTNISYTRGSRGFGSAEVEWAIEQQMDMIAERLGMDPVEVKKKEPSKRRRERRLWNGHS